jgi:flagellar biosynthesis chaperone FliJ
VRPFRFRAQAAVDLRRREFDEARRVLARASIDLRAAEDVRAEAEARLLAARDVAAREQGGEMRGSIDTARWQWHRSWILRLEHERAVCAADVAARERDVSRAAAAAQTARQRLEVLERFREKARRAWEHVAAAEEQKQIDALATLRHVAALRESAQRSRT